MSNDHRTKITIALLGMSVVLSLTTAPVLAQDGNSAGLGNLAGAAEVCGFRGTANQLRSQARDIGSFEGARQSAMNSRQNCSDVSNTLRGLGVSGTPYYQGNQGRRRNNGRNNFNNFNSGNNNFNRGNNDPYSLGNLAGAAEACENGGYTNQLRSQARDQATFENARNIARRSRQDCNQVNATLQQQGGYFGGQTVIAGGYAGQLGNLAGAAEVCGINGYTDNLRNRSGDFNTFEQSRNRARNSRQDCNQVTYTLQQGNY